MIGQNNRVWFVIVNILCCSRLSCIDKDVWVYFFYNFFKLLSKTLIFPFCLCQSGTVLSGFVTRSDSYFYEMKHYFGKQWSTIFATVRPYIFIDIYLWGISKLLDFMWPETFFQFLQIWNSWIAVVTGRLDQVEGLSVHFGVSNIVFYEVG